MDLPAKKATSFGASDATTAPDAGWESPSSATRDLSPMTPASLRWASDLAVIASLAHSASMTVSVVFSLAPLTSGGMHLTAREDTSAD